MSFVFFLKSNQYQRPWMASTVLGTDHFFFNLAGGWGGGGEGLENLHMQTFFIYICDSTLQTFFVWLRLPANTLSFYLHAIYFKNFHPTPNGPSRIT